MMVRTWVLGEVATHSKDLLYVILFLVLIYFKFDILLLAVEGIGSKTSMFLQDVFRQK